MIIIDAGASIGSVGAIRITAALHVTIFLTGEEGIIKLDRNDNAEQVIDYLKENGFPNAKIVG